MRSLFHVSNKIHKSTLTSWILNDIILLKFERFRLKALNFKRLYFSILFVDETCQKLVG